LSVILWGVFKKKYRGPGKSGRREYMKNDRVPCLLRRNQHSIADHLDSIRDEPLDGEKVWGHRRESLEALRFGTMLKKRCRCQPNDRARSIWKNISCVKGPRGCAPPCHRSNRRQARGHPLPPPSSRRPERPDRTSKSGVARSIAVLIEEGSTRSAAATPPP
jgi:hypothetical protein